MTLFACQGGEPQPGDSCGTIDDCIASQGLACKAGECVRESCERSAACPVGAACVSGICQLPECDDDDDCNNRHRCWEGDCRSDVCAVKAECEEGLVCIGAPPTCKQPPSRCGSDADCVTDTYCKLPEERCESRCTSDDSCPPGFYCGDEFCRPECRSESDCTAGRVCVEGRCEDDRCGERTCSDSKPFLDPVSCRCVSCLDDSDCSVDAQERCSGERRCLFCLIREDDSTECTAQGLRHLEGCCVECADDRDCPGGTHCEAGRCIADDPRECVLDEDCEAPARCDLGWCVIPGSKTPCDVQADCPAGEACYDDGRCRAEADVCIDCTDPGRCVAEPGDDAGTCAGCNTPCDASGCAAGMTCFVPAEASEGFCVAAELVECR